MKLKENVLPQFFDCQPDRQRSAKPTLRKSYENLKHKAAVAEILSNKVDIKQMDKTHTNDRVAEKFYDTDGIHSITNDENQYEKENSSILIKNSFVLQENQQLNIQNNITNQHNIQSKIIIYFNKRESKFKSYFSKYRSEEICE